MHDLLDIPIQESILFNKVFHNEAALNKHISNYLSGEETALLVAQFPQPLSSLEDAGVCLYMLSWASAFMKGADYRAQNPIQPISLKTEETNWFFEARGKTEVFLKLYDFIILRLNNKLPTQDIVIRQKTKKTKTSYHKKYRNLTRVLGKKQLVQRISNQVPYQEEYWEEIKQPQTVEVKSVENVQVSQVDEIIKKIDRLEIYRIDNTVKAANLGSKPLKPSS